MIGVIYRCLACLRLERSSLLQRLPIISHISFAIILGLCPQHFPRLVGMSVIALHLMLCIFNLRTVYGAFAAWHGVAAHCAIDWQARYRSLTNSLPARSRADTLPFEAVSHLIMIPSYEESIETLRETLRLLSTHSLASTTYHPVLCMEARELGSVAKALLLVQEFSGAFGRIGYTVHPSGIEGEANGKSANLAWAVRHAWLEMKDDMQLRRDISSTVVTCIDSDTALAGDYFAAISCKFALQSTTERHRMWFVTPTCFDRNAHEVPVSVRLTDMMWSLAGMSTIYPGSSAKIPTSAYSLPLDLAASVGFHDTGPEAIGEDMHMFIKCLFATAGNLLAQTIYSPASQLNVVAFSTTGWLGYWNSHVARYNQALRHMWGSLDSGYAARLLLRGDLGPQTIQDIVESLQRSQGATVFPIRDVGQLGAMTVENLAALGRVSTLSSRSTACEHKAWKTGSMSDTSSETSSGTSSGTSIGTSADTSLLNEVEAVETYWCLVGEREGVKVQWMPVVSLFARLYEAHFLMGHMVILVVTRMFASAVVAVPLKPTYATIADAASFLQWVYAVTDAFRVVSPLSLLIALILYERYHQQCVKHRWKRAGDRLGIQSSDKSQRRFPFSLFDLIFLPVGIVFGVVPLFHAQILHLFTNRLTYRVSLKPVPVHKTGHGGNA